METLRFMSFHALAGAENMKASILPILSNIHKKSLTIVFPSRVISTNVDALREELARFWQTAEGKINKWRYLFLEFSQTDFVDSIGLNLVFELVRLAKSRRGKVVATLGSHALRLIFYTVRLDKKMEIRFTEDR